MRRPIAIALTTVAVVLVAASVTATASTVLTTKMNGTQETPKGAPKGSGSATITLNAAKGKVCFKLTWSGIGNPTASHIHQGAKGKAGPVVVPLFAATPKHSGCVSAAKSLIAKIAKKPGGYYVNVHTAKYPGGAVRGQL